MKFLVTKFSMDGVKGKVLAFFDVRLVFGSKDWIELRDCMLIKGENGVFVSLPAKLGFDDRYYDLVLMSKGWKSLLNKYMIEYYERVVGMGDTPPHEKGGSLNVKLS
jgi:DNA-binding cell septation regulator SpoVG